MISFGEMVYNQLEELKALRCAEEKPLMHGEEVSTLFGFISQRWCGICKDWTIGVAPECPICRTAWSSEDE